MAVLCRHALVFAFTLGTETDLRPHSPEQWVTGLLTDTISQFLEILADRLASLKRRNTLSNTFLPCPSSIPFERFAAPKIPPPSPPHNSS